MRKRKTRKHRNFKHLRAFQEIGAGGGNRTRTPSLATDFESASSTSSNTPASMFFKIRSGQRTQKIGGTPRRDIKNQINIELLKALINQGLARRARETAK